MCLNSLAPNDCDHFITGTCPLFTNLCPGDDIVSTCEANVTAFIWEVTTDNIPTTCVAQREPVISITDPTCGPNDEFSLGVNEDGSSTLTTQSVNESLNMTRIQCLDGDVDQKICVIGKAACFSCMLGMFALLSSTRCGITT